MNLYKTSLVAFILCVFSFNVVATENNNALVKTRITFNIPSSVKLATIEATLKDIADKYSDKFSEYKGIMPDDIPDQPEEALETHSAATINFDKSLYAIRAYTHSTWFGNTYAQVYITTLYPYEGGYRLYLYTYFKTQQNILGQLGGALVDSMSDITLDTGFSDTIKARDWILKEIPQIQIYRQSPAILAEYNYDYNARKIVKVVPVVIPLAIKVESTVQIESSVKEFSKQESK